MLKADSVTGEIQIEQTYFKSNETNTIHTTYNELMKLKKEAKECISQSLIKQNGLEDRISFFCPNEPQLIDNEKRIVKVNDTTLRRLSIQITNKYVVNVIEELKDKNKIKKLKINWNEFRHITTKFYFFFSKYST